jgi:hypothetical protein
MTFAELQKALETVAGGLRVDGAQLQSAHITSLLTDFLPNGVFDLRNATSKPEKFNLDGQELDAIHVVGTLSPEFLGMSGLGVDAWFFLGNDSAEVVCNVKGMPDPWQLSVSFRAAAGPETDSALFYTCVFTLDSRQPDLFGKDFDSLFHSNDSDDAQKCLVYKPESPTKRGLSLTAELQVCSPLDDADHSGGDSTLPRQSQNSAFDERLADFVQIPSGRLKVAGPIKIVDNWPYARLSTQTHVASFTFQTVELLLDYQFLTAPVAGESANPVQKALERLTTTLVYKGEKETLTVPLAITFAPNSLAESLILRGDFGQSSPLSLQTLTGLLPVDIPALPKEFPKLEKLALTDLSFELTTQPMALGAAHVRLELPDKWTIVPKLVESGPNLVEFGNLRLDLTVSHYGDDWELLTYVMGDLTVAGGNLTGVYDTSAKSFFCMLDDSSVVDLKQLFEQTLKLGNFLPMPDKFDLTRFEIRGDHGAGSYAFDIATSIEWPLDLGAKTIGIKDLFLSLEFADGSQIPTGRLGGSLAIGGVTAGIVAAYDPDGWTFKTTVYNVRLTDLLADILGDGSLSNELPDVEFPLLDLTVTPKTKAFNFHGVAEISWNSPFGTDAQFACNVDLTLERAAPMAMGNGVGVGNQSKASSINCKIAVDGEGSAVINGKKIGATINVVATNQSTGGGSGNNGRKSLEITAGGSLRIPLDSGDLSFKLAFHTGANSKRITATWPARSNGGDSKDAVLDFKVLGSQLGLDLQGVPKELIPTLTEVTFDYDFAHSQLLLGAETTNTKLVFLTAPGLSNPSDGAGNSKDSTPAPLYAFILDAQIPVTLSDLPLIGQKLASFANMGVEGLRVSVISEPLTTAEIDGFNTLIAGNDPSLPTLPSPADTNEQLQKGGLILLRVRTGETSNQLTFRIGAGQGKSGMNGVRRRSIGPEGNVREYHIGGEQPVDVPSTVPDVSWLNIQRSFGPANIKRIGASYSNGDIQLALDAGFALSALSLDLQGLTLAFPVRSFSVEKIRADLHGMALAYQSGPVSITGGFLEVIPKPGLKFEYNGQARIVAANFSLSAIGSFAEFTDGKPSLFLFADLDAPIGGPGFFFVTGIAAGFGYNRSLTLPMMSALPAFPLVAAAMPTTAHPDPFAGSAASDPTSALSVMDDYVSTAYGENWLAAGIKFTSFKLLESFALLTVSFGTRVEVALLGLSALTMPTGATEPIGFAELAIEVVFSPDDGVLMVAAQLTPESYILSRDCHLTGGFAFFSWFKDNPRTGARAGEFVVTFGGYNPHFNPPAYYPLEPRIGANWQVSDRLSIKGGLYFALTPSVVMAGGFLQANFQSGNLRAWFDTEADFLLTWKPFHYEAWMGLHIGASYQVGSSPAAFTIEAHVGADVHLWGPKFGGTATVDLYVCSFTVNFGNTTEQPVPLLSWPDFRQSFLPPVLAGRNAQSKAPHYTEAHARALAFARANLGASARKDNPPIPTDTYCLMRISGGLIKDLTGEKKDENDIDYVVNPEEFAITTASVMPCTSAVLVTGDGAVACSLNFSAAPFGVAPVGINNNDLQSVHTIRFHQIDPKSHLPLGTFKAAAEWVTPVHSDLPRAAWFKNAATDSTRMPTVEQMNDQRTVQDALTGTNLQPAAPSPDHTAKIDIATLLCADEPGTDLKKAFYNPLDSPIEDNFDQSKVWEQLRLINDTAAARNEIITALRRQNVSVRDGSTVSTDYLSVAAGIAEEAVKAGNSVPAPVLRVLGEAKAT